MTSFPTPLPCYCLSDPQSGRLLYASPTAAALAPTGGLPDYAWELWGGESLRESYCRARLSAQGSATLTLSGGRVLFSTLVRQDDKTLRQDILIALARPADLFDREELPPAPDEVRVTTFGGFAVETARGRLSGGDIPSRQSCLLLLYLLCNRDRTAPVYELAEALWPGQLLDLPYNMVKNVAFRLRRQLASISVKPLITPYHGTYVLNPGLRFNCDSDRFDELIRRYYRDPSQADPEWLAQALRLYGGSLLPGFDTELWLIARTQYYKNAYRRAVLDYANLLRQKGDSLALYALLRDAVGLYPQEASLHMAMIQALAQDKGPAAARQYLQSVAPLLSPAQHKAVTAQLEQLAQMREEKQ